MFFKIGDKVKAVRTIWFCDETRHIEGQEFYITEKNTAYFNMNEDAYEKIYDGYGW